MNQLLESLDYAPQEGRLTLQAARHLLVRPSLLVEVQKALETQIPHEAGSVLVRVSQTDGVALGMRFKEVFAYSEDQVLSSFAFMLGESGWGATTLEMLNLESKEIVLKVIGSPFAEEYGPSVNPVCHLLLGLFEGLAMAVFDLDEVEGQEVQCAARGDGCCRFAVSAKPVS